MGQAHEHLLDDELFRLLSEKDEHAITCLFDRYSRVVYSTAVRVLHDDAAAEDVMQEVFINLWLRPPCILPTNGSLTGWFVVAARNRAISVLRSRRSISPIEDVTMASPFDLAGEAEVTALFDYVCRLMEGLPQTQQRVLRLAFLEGLTHTEIATATGHALGTVKKRIRTGLMTLQKELELKTVSC